CNYFDINPYALLSSGCLLLTADKGHDLVESLHKKGIDAAVIGRTTDSNDRLIINEEEKRFLTPAQQDEYFKLV
ncbi:MAG: hydrogenase maturation factor, partial [Lachnospiraceae bacterium]|nr:hydrogenase maturation factor [Lachnospiraceae bacterium]